MTENNSKKKTFAERAASEPTELHKRFAKWIEEQTGHKADLKTVQLAVAMRMDFQRSDENQASLTDKKTAAAAKETERKAKRLAKLQAELAKLTGEDEPKVEEVDEQAPEPEPVAEATETEEAPAEPVAEVEVKAEVETAPAEEEKVEEAPKPRARRSRRTAGQQPVV